MKNSTNDGGPRYWLLTGEVPQGPFDVAQVHDKLALGEATWQTPACPVGGSTWLPLVQTPGLGPSSPAQGQILNALPVEEGPAARGVPASTVSDAPTAGDPPTTAPAPAGKVSWGGMVLAVLVFAFCGWLGYGWLRPLTPREVCERFDNARDAREATRHCTLNLHPAVEEMFRRPDQKHPEDKSEYTQEGEAPPGVGGYFVGVRGQLYIPEERRRVQLDGVYHLVKGDGWKIEDMYVLSVDRQPLEQPISLARDYLRLQGQGDAQPAQPASRTGSDQGRPTQAKAWYESRGAQQAAGHGIARFLSSGGGKALGLILLGVIVAVLRFGRELWEFFTSGTRR